MLLGVPLPVAQDQCQRLAQVVAVCWWALCFAIIFFMQSGFLLLEAGSVRAKNAAHVAAKVLAHTGIATFCFWAVGFAIKGFAWPLCYVLRQSGTGVPLARIEDAITGYVGWAGRPSRPVWGRSDAPRRSVREPPIRAPREKQLVKATPTEPSRVPWPVQRTTARKTSKTTACPRPDRFNRRNVAMIFRQSRFPLTVLATVLSACGLFSAPAPEVGKPEATIFVEATYPGANANTVAETVAAPTSPAPSVVSRQVAPPSVDSSTRVMWPCPDQAYPRTVTRPAATAPLGATLIARGFISASGSSPTAKTDSPAC